MYICMYMHTYTHIHRYTHTAYMRCEDVHGYVSVSDVHVYVYACHTCVKETSCVCWKLSDIECN